VKYRAEIDGLRALAVVPVILYHAGFQLFSGGFVGVDVFYVISGYLITNIILMDIDKGKFSLVHFYERRARRLLPAYRGCFSTPWSIINEEKYVGYTYHYISENFDEGDVLFQEKIKISDEDTAHSLSYKIFQKGLSNLIKVISLIGSNGKPQLGPAHYYKNKPPFDGKINPNWTIKEKNNFIKAMYFPPYENSLDLLDDYGNDRI